MLVIKKISGKKIAIKKDLVVSVSESGQYTCIKYMKYTDEIGCVETNEKFEKIMEKMKND